MRPSVVLIAGLAALPLLAGPPSAAAQSGFHPRWEIAGFDISRNGAWRVKARTVARLRAQFLAGRNFGALNAPITRGVSGPADAAVTGTVRVPALLFSYAETDVSFMRDTAQYSTLLFGAVPPPGNPYTLRTFYEQMSTKGAGPALFSMQGKVMGWVRLPKTELSYTGQPGTCSGNLFGTTNCNGIFSGAAIKSMHNGMRVALARVDTGATGIDFSQFDDDGPDGNPNSADDDGYVDMMMFAHATQDGACPGSTNNHIWAHRYALGATSEYVTNDASAKPGFGNIRVSDYFVQSALGGRSSCSADSIMPISTAAHEFGHALGLPDLYDTGGQTEGIGRWGLMSSGNYSSSLSPARMEAWSLYELGWVTVVPLGTTGTYSFGAAPVSDTAFFVNVQGTNTRNEHFLLENRQAAQADTALLRDACRVSYQPNPPPGSCAGGLLIWHVDGNKVDTWRFGGGNSVNVGTIHGLKLEEADGGRDLWCPGAVPFDCNRGDAGDPYPGITGNTAFVFRTNPRATKNLDMSFAGFGVDQITQVVPGGEMSFRLRFGALTVVRGSDTNAVILVDGSGADRVFRDLFDDGSTHTVSVADTQLSPDFRTRWRFASWSDGGLRTHDITGSLAGGTYIANLNRDFRLVATANGGGTIVSNPAVNLASEFIAEGNAVWLTAIPASGIPFAGWSGDTTSSNAVIMLPMARPYTVTALFVASTDVVAQLLGPTAPLTPAQLQTLDANGNNNGSFDIGDFLAWVKTRRPPRPPR